MSVSPVDNSGGTTRSGGGTTNAAAPNADYETFVKLLVAQMKNQDPTEPMDSTQFVSQLASFSAVEQAIQTNSKLDSILVNGPISQAEGYIGKYLKYDDGNGTKVEGTVQSVTIYSDGLTAKLDNGKEIVIGPGVTVMDKKPDTSEKA
ncbi:flagellar hook assembly protein FlgD [Bartonella sp. LJL80]